MFGFVRGQVQKQIDAVCGERQPVLNDRSSLSKVEATIYEVARLASVITMSVAHSPTHDTTFEGYFIPEVSQNAFCVVRCFSESNMEVICTVSLVYLAISAFTNKKSTRNTKGTLGFYILMGVPASASPPI